MSHQPQEVADDGLQMFRDSAAGFLGAADQRQRFRRLEASGGGLDRACWEQLAELGWFSLLVPEEDGGLGLGLAEVAAIAQEAGRHLLPEPLVDAGVQPLALLARLARGGLRDQLLADLQVGRRVVGLAWQESAGELEPASGMTHARLPAGGSAVLGETLRVTGTKRFVRPGPGADGWIVAADLASETALVWVDAQASGLQVEHESGVDGMGTATLRMDEAQGQLLAHGPEALAAMQAANDIARFAQAAELAGIARRTLELTCDYLRTRVQFGKPIGSFQLVQMMMVKMLGNLTAMIGLALRASELQDQLGPKDELSALAKQFCAAKCREVVQLARESMGGNGILLEYHVARLFADAEAIYSYEGSNEINAMIVGRAVTGYSAFV